MSYKNVKHKLEHLIYRKNNFDNTRIIISQDKLLELKAWCKCEDADKLIMRNREPNKFLGVPIIVVETKDGIAEIGHVY